MKIITQIIRFLVAFTFIFSGFVKLVDPIGTKIKMLEYFGSDVLNLTFLNPMALEISIFLIIVEFGLGVFLLFGIFSKFTSRSLLLLISVFLFLTWYSAYYNKVTDCGCFGDAIKLSVWETFYKNVILFFFILWLNFHYKHIQPIFEKKLSKTLAYTLIFIGFILSLYSLYYLPVIDFRPYALGKNIKQGMIIPENAPKPEFKEKWFYKINGKIKEFTTADEPWNIPGAEFIKRETQTISEGYVPPIHDFSIENEVEGDITENVLNADEVYLIISYNPSNISPDALKKINTFAKKLKQKNKKVIGLFSETDENLRKQLDFPLYLTDQTTLKTMIRSNPGILKLHKGTIVEKKSWRSLP